MTVYGGLVEAWGDVNEATLRRAWEKLTPHVVTRVEGAQRLTDTVEQAATEARRVPGFNNVTIATFVNPSKTNLRLFKLMSLLLTLNLTLNLWQDPLVFALCHFLSNYNL
ncbi:hypothetical protein E2C01_024912 [Portunus trituberculatus]|uniref:Uncharacterized protein n=1 Tax=Portunus trituberculatus TaxID=210409 RepID=A0A5B7EE76_PORTR|nr:hypothetical protein [Portunus trituberculatus]